MDRFTGLLLLLSARGGKISKNAYKQLGPTISIFRNPRRDPKDIRKQPPRQSQNREGPLAVFCNSKESDHDMNMPS